MFEFLFFRLVLVSCVLIFCCGVLLVALFIVLELLLRINLVFVGLVTWLC